MPRNNLKKTVQFQFYAPLAKEVAVAGSFNDWDASALPLESKGKGKWSVRLKLPCGRYEYRYLIDGVWHNEQRPVECVPNAFGSWNCVLLVK